MKKLLAALALMAFASISQSQTLDFTLSASSSDGATVVPRLTWSTTPAATSCTASGTAGSGWSGVKAASGTQTLAAVSASQAYALQCTWPGATRATITWTAPTQNEDGTAYTNPAGYKVSYGTTATTRTTHASITNPATLTWQSPVLTPGTYFFGVRAVNTLGLESEDSNIVSKVATADVSQTRNLNLGFTVPNAPVLQ